MSKSFYEVDMHVDDLAEFLFLKNVNNVSVELSLGGIENNKDLFFFCLDLFCKGLVFLYGEGTKSVTIDKLTEKQFQYIQNKMLCAGIHVNLVVFPLDIELDVVDTEASTSQISQQNKCVLNVDELTRAPDSMPIKDYEFKLFNNDMMYVISFELIHNKSV